jgi:pimeloyl-ACP methyl ester carboxylesterase
LDIFVGGYLDNHMPGGGVMKGYADSYAKQTGRPTRYLPNGRIGQIADAIREGNADGGPVNLVGHSWGGPDVYDAAALATAKGLKVDNLITLDPVSGPSHAPHGPQHAGTWMNVVGSPSQPDRTDWITNFPGFSQKPSNLPIQQADQTVSVDRNHGDVDGMMRDSGARALLDRSRQLAPADSTDADMSASRPGPLNDDLPMDDWIAARQAQMQQGAAASAPGM